MTVRNAMEDFHVKHLTDDQMKELNPIIRNAICTCFHMIENFSDPRVAEYMAFQQMLIPSYWEEPELLDDYVQQLTITKKEKAEAARRLAEAIENAKPDIDGADGEILPPKTKSAKKPSRRS